MCHALGTVPVSRLLGSQMLRNAVRAEKSARGPASFWVMLLPLMMMLVMRFVPGSQVMPCHVHQSPEGGDGSG